MVTFISLNLYYIRLFTCTERHIEIGVFDDLKRDNESRLYTNIDSTYLHAISNIFESI